MRVLVLADTHAPRRWKGLPVELLAPLQEADVVLHAGDVCTPEVLDTLAEHAPVHVVLGNNDGPAVAAWGAPETLELDLDGLRVAMIHDAGPRAGRDRRMRRRFPDADLVVYGHSHIPLDEPEGAVHLLNPGSPTDRRRQPHGTYAVLQIAAGRLVASQVVALDDPRRVV
ncbi:metallophosphoesterase family protein [Arsenicicoccus sp. oral taxon 190]|uniref:metallophosphoesterase family protein n=1 Tax=Arsenicicoccus sp. oral taxon 190 TaxID=1658671 RepID=UPI00067A122A|nr:metallophosphoesterase family protein [Arsenicicoccus sp. oral taxon 190]AKT50401.1 phosphodiesterase [Arsenicicoccus sp. oral taxon 190]